MKFTTGCVTKKMPRKITAKLKKPRMGDWLSAEEGFDSSRSDGARVKVKGMGGRLGHFHSCSLISMLYYGNLWKENQGGISINHPNK